MNIMSNTYLSLEKRNVVSFQGSNRQDEPNSPQVLGYDDAVSKARRNYIREHYNSFTMPYYSIYEKEGRLEPYELNKLISSLRGEKLNQDSLENVITKVRPKMEAGTVEIPKEKVNFELMKNTPLYNVDRIWSRITPNSYRGQSPFENPASLKLLKDAGIKMVVDLCGYTGFEDVVRKSGLDYFSFIVKEDFFMKDIFSTRTDSCAKLNNENFLNDFVKFIQTMQKDYVYIGCEYGKYKTDNALMVNKFFNPAFEDGKSYITNCNNIYLDKLENLYNNLKPEHKTLMGWTKEFDSNFLPKLYKAIKQYKMY